MKLYRRFACVALALAAVVVVFGAYVRLSDAGLGCPDWPGCYSQPTPYHAATAIGDAHAADPHGPVSLPKAWKEMIHRYLAAGLGLLIVVLAMLAWRLRDARNAAGSTTLGSAAPGSTAPLAATLLVCVVVIQALLGKWTVTLLLKPAIVTGHLLGGLAVLALLTWIALRASGARRHAGGGLALAARLGFVLLIGQIALGGWTSTNYAALACTGFPACGRELWPVADYANAFHLVRDLGMTGDGELLPFEALVAIHWSHRVGAVLVGVYLFALGWRLVQHPAGAEPGRALLAALVLQIGLGIGNVLLSLPLPLAIAHNGGAALLVMAMVWVNYRFAAASTVGRDIRYRYALRQQGERA